MVPFLEDILNYDYLPGWGRLMKELEGYFNSRWGRSWKKSEEKFWKEFDEKTSAKKIKSKPRPMLKHEVFFGAGILIYL